MSAGMVGGYGGGIVAGGDDDGGFWVGEEVGWGWDRIGKTFGRVVPWFWKLRYDVMEGLHHNGCRRSRFLGHRPAWFHIR